MLSVKWHQYQWPWVTVKVTSAFWNEVLYLRKYSTCYLGCVHTQLGNCMSPIILTVASKMKDSLSSRVTYTVKVIISWKQYKIQTSNMRWWMAYQIVPFLMTLSDRPDYSTIARLFTYWKPLQMQFLYSCAAANKIVTYLDRLVVTMWQLNVLVCLHLCLPIGTVSVLTRGRLYRDWEHSCMLHDSKPWSVKMALWQAEMRMIRWMSDVQVADRWCNYSAAAKQVELVWTYITNRWKWLGVKCVDYDTEL